MSTANQQLLLPELTKDLAPVQQGWLKLAAIKEAVFKDLANKELIVQGFVLSVKKKESYEKVKEGLAQAKTAAGEAKAQRLLFTGSITDKIITPAMEFEKRNDALIKEAEAIELEMRKAEAAKAQEVGAALTEENAFKAHFVNENFRIAAAYRQQLMRLTAQYYETALKKKIKGSVALKEFKDGVAVILRQVEIDKPAKFDRKLLTAARAAELYAEVRPYAPADDLEAAIKDIDRVFGMYFEDLKNATAAVAAVNSEVEKKVAAENKGLAAETAINTLVANTEISITAPVVKKDLKPVIGDTAEWAMGILIAGLANWNAVITNLKVKKWSSLTVEQIATALTKHIAETGKSISGVETREVEK